MADEDLDLDDVDPEVLIKARWLQNKITRDGIDGIGFMAHAEERAERGDQDVGMDISRQLRKL